jgi:tyrosyl-tRNA synthetase
MLGKDSVSNRLETESGISYTEFSYMLLQAFDFVQLAKLHGCRLQVGGSDQYGNITAGCELQHKLRGPKVFGLTAPLLLDSAGEKMGKTSSGERIWLDPARTPPYAFYQYWLNRDDEAAARLLRLFSLRPLAELAELLREHDTDRSRRNAQRELARALTAWVHGAAMVSRVETASRVMFGESLDGLTDADLGVLAGTVPTIDVPRTELATGVGIVDLLARTIADSRGAARRLVTQGGAYINNRRVTEVEHQVTLEHLATETMIVVRGGKKDYCLVRVT